MRDVPVVISTLFETGIGIAAARAAAAALPAVRRRAGAGRLPHGLATAGLLEHDLLARAAASVDEGRSAAPGGEGAGGLGIALDDRALRRFAVEAVEAAG